LLAIALGYVAYLPAIPLTHFVQPDDQARMFEYAIGIATALYGIFAGLLGYHRPRQWLPAVVLPWPFVLGGIASVIAFRGTDFEPVAVGLLLAPIVATLVGWRGGRAIRYRSVG
jgi:hypothetical protein